MTSVLIRRGRGTERHGAEIEGMLPQAKEMPESLGNKRGKKDSPLVPLEEPWTADTLTLDFQPPKLLGNHFLLF